MRPNWISEEEFHKIYKGTNDFCWMDYMRLGISLADGTVLGWGGMCPYVDSFYILTSDSSWGPPVASKWVRIKVRKEKSNLDLYQIRCEGNDDTSFSIHIIGREDVDKEIKWLKNCINLKTKDCQKRKYFFTN